MTDDMQQNRIAKVEPVIYVAPLGELQVYPIYGHELDEFAQGSPVSLCLNFALALLASGVSFFATLLATDIPSSRTFNVFVILTVLFLLAGTVLLAIWWKLHRSTRSLAQRIRNRMPPAPGVPAT
jgi:hypothetical protein